MKKWTKAEREEAARKTKAWHARRKRDTRITDVAPGDVRIFHVGSGAASGGSGGSANASGYAVMPKQELAIDVVKLIAHDVPADVIVKVVERILRS